MDLAKVEWQDQGIDVEELCRALAEFFSKVSVQELTVGEGGEFRSVFLISMPSEERFALFLLKDRLAAGVGPVGTEGPVGTLGEAVRKGQSVPVGTDCGAPVSEGQPPRLPSVNDHADVQDEEVQS